VARISGLLQPETPDPIHQLSRERGLGCEAETAAARVRAARTGGPINQGADGEIRQGTVRTGETEGSGLKNLNVNGSTAGFANIESESAPAALKLTHQFHLPSHRHKHPRVGIALQDHRSFAHTSDGSSATA